MSDQTNEQVPPPYARLTLEVEVFLETNPGTDTPSGRELPYDYLVIRSVATSSTQILGPPGAVELLALDGTDDLDADSLLINEVADALLATSPVDPH